MQSRVRGTREYRRPRENSAQPHPQGGAHQSARREVSVECVATSEAIRRDLTIELPRRRCDLAPAANPARCTSTARLPATTSPTVLTGLKPGTRISRRSRTRGGFRWRRMRSPLPSSMSSVSSLSSTDRAAARARPAHIHEQCLADAAPHDQKQHTQPSGERRRRSANPETGPLANGWTTPSAGWIEYPAEGQVIEDAGISPRVAVTAGPSDPSMGAIPFYERALRRDHSLEPRPQVNTG